MKKDIYVIRNTVNDMCYVGQSVDYLTRFRKHKEGARRNNFHYKSLLYNAMNKIGIDKFYVEPLERQIENYNEREIFWINKLHTLRPNGYNLTAGGDWYPNLSGVLHHNATITSAEDLASIYGDLLNTGDTLTDIAKRFGVRYGVVADINQGKTYRIPGYDYPLREFVLSKGKLDRLTFDLKYSNKSFNELSSVYDLSIQQVKAINFGRSWKRDYLTYPIRRTIFPSSCEVDSVEKIQKDLISTTMSFDEIAEKYHCSANTVRRINDGTAHKSDVYQYPLRRSTAYLSQESVNLIHDKLLYSDESVNKIAQDFDVSSATIKRINNGETVRYRDARYAYPLRPM